MLSDLRAGVGCGRDDSSIYGSARPPFVPTLWMLFSFQQGIHSTCFEGMSFLADNPPNRLSQSSF